MKGDARSGLPVPRDDQIFGRCAVLTTGRDYSSVASAGRVTESPRTSSFTTGVSAFNMTSSDERDAIGQTPQQVASAQTTSCQELENSKNGDNGHVKRPMNAFMVWSKDERRKEAQVDPTKHNSSISVDLGQRWAQLPEAEKSIYQEKARILREEHKKKYPDYKYKPRRRKKFIKKPGASLNSVQTAMEHYMAQQKVAFAHNPNCACRSCSIVAKNIPSGNGGSPACYASRGTMGSSCSAQVQPFGITEWLGTECHTATSEGSTTTAHPTAPPPALPPLGTLTSTARSLPKSPVPSPAAVSSDSNIMPAVFPQTSTEIALRLSTATKTAATRSFPSPSPFQPQLSSEASQLLCSAHAWMKSQSTSDNVQPRASTPSLQSPATLPVTARSLSQCPVQSSSAVGSDGNIMSAAFSQTSTGIALRLPAAAKTATTQSFLSPRLSHPQLSSDSPQVSCSAHSWIGSQSSSDTMQVGSAFPESLNIDLDSFLQAASAGAKMTYPSMLLP